MNLRELIDAYRDRADDAKTPYRADDKQVTAWFNEAIDEAAIRGKLIFDATSPFCTMSVVVDQAVYKLAPCIIEIAAARTDKYRWTLDGTDQSALDRAGQTYALPGRYGRRRGLARCEYWAQWRLQKGHPRFFIQDEQRLQLVPIPTEADTVHLEVYRTTTDDERMKDSQDCPRIATAHHSGLVDWALYRAYLRRDEDQTDSKLASDHLALFEQRYGLRPDANVARKRNERRAHITPINWP